MAASCDIKIGAQRNEVPHWSHLVPVAEPERLERTQPENFRGSTNSTPGVITRNGKVNQLSSRNRRILP